MNLLVDTTIVTTSDRPDLVPVVAGWLWEAFWRSYGCTLQHVLDDVGGAVARVGPPQCFVLLQGGQPVGTASLAAKDLDTRPDLTPWLAGVWVAPEARGRGHATRLIRAVEAACRAAALPELWLYTLGAEGVYLRAGWRTAEHFTQNGLRAALMRRDLAADGG